MSKSSDMCMCVYVLDCLSHTWFASLGQDFRQVLGGHGSRSVGRGLGTHFRFIGMVVSHGVFCLEIGLKTELRDFRFWVPSKCFF